MLNGLKYIKKNNHLTNNAVFETEYAGILIVKLETPIKSIKLNELISEIKFSYSENGRGRGSGRGQLYILTGPC